MKNSGSNKKKLIIFTGILFLAGIFFINSRHAAAPENFNEIIEIKVDEQEMRDFNEEVETEVSEQEVGMGITKKEIADKQKASNAERDLGPEEKVIENTEDVVVEENAELALQKILHSVPFVSQAPFGDWADQRQQDGCEEASILMAIKWARGENLSKEEALKEILAASDYILEKYGEYRDTDLDDALAWIVKDYFAFENAELKKNISKTDLIAILEAGKVIVAPMNGQALKNPNFTAPGPINHMLLIRGYDPKKKKFITNDPGTRRGELYEYDEDLLFSALRAYPTGYHETNKEIRKNILVFWK